MPAHGSRIAGGVGRCPWLRTADSCPSRRRPCGTRSPNRRTTPTGSSARRRSATPSPGFRHPGRSSITRSASGRSRVRDHTEVIEAVAPQYLRLRAKGRPLGTASVTLRLTPVDGGTSVEIVEHPDGVVLDPRAEPGAAGRDQGPQRRVADAPRGAGAAVKGSLWLETAPPAPEFPRLDADITADVAVIGGGIVGVTTALLLHEAGVRVVLLEANRIGHGVTGHTTAKVSSQHGLMYSRLRVQARGRTPRARTAPRTRPALAWIADRVRRDGIDCDFRRARRRTSTRPKRSDIEDEAEAAVEAGLPAALVEQHAAAVPGRRRGALRRPGGVPRPEVPAGARAPAPRGLRAHARGPGRTTRSGRRAAACCAEHTIVATHFPFPDRSLAFARVHPQRSYALACRIAGDAARRHVHQRRLADAQRARRADR